MPISLFFDRQHLAALVLAITLVGVSSLVRAETGTQDSELVYHGFYIDARRATDAERAITIPAIEKQLEIVESVGLPAAVLAHFRKIPLVLDPELKSMPGQYWDKGANGMVTVWTRDMPTNKPIVLHEFLHGYHFRVLTLDNPEITGAYARALQSGMYPERFRRAPFLENPKEYFAIMGTIYLFGHIQQPPYDCAVLAKNDSAYLEFMSKLFGEHPCH